MSENSPSPEASSQNSAVPINSPGIANLMLCRILIVDDHPAMRRGLRTLLGSHPEWEIVAEAEDGIEAVEKALQLKRILWCSTLPCLEWMAWKRAGGSGGTCRNRKS